MQSPLLVIASVIASTLILAAVMWWLTKSRATGSDQGASDRLVEAQNKIKEMEGKLEAKSNELTAALSSKAGLEAAFEAKVNAFEAQSTQFKEEANLSRTKRDKKAQEYDSLTTALNDKSVALAISEAKRGSLETQIVKLNDELTLCRTERDKKTQDLERALAQQQSTEDAIRQFENLSRKVLETTLENATDRIGKITESLKSSAEEQLQRHAGDVAKTLEPLQMKLAEYDKAVETLKDASATQYGGLKNQMEDLLRAEKSLDDQAKALTKALSSGPKLRGSYGELMLQQCVEFVGMKEHYHFETQVGRDTEEGRKIPDMVVMLPGGQKVVVDAKATMSAYIEALKTDDESQRAVLLKNHCSNVRNRVKELSGKNYPKYHENAVEVVVLFLPAEHLYQAAMENDHELTEFAMGLNIIICGPSGLMMLLKVANQVWTRAAIEKEAQQIAKAGGEVYEHAKNFIVKFSAIGKSIKSLHTVYNTAQGTLDRDLLRTANILGKFEALGTDKEDIPDTTKLDYEPKGYRSVEFKDFHLNEEK